MKYGNGGGGQAIVASLRAVNKTKLNTVLFQKRDVLCGTEQTIIDPRGDHMYNTGDIQRYIYFVA